MPTKIKKAKTPALPALKKGDFIVCLANAKTKGNFKTLQAFKVAGVNRLTSMFDQDSMLSYRINIVSANVHLPEDQDTNHYGICFYTKPDELHELIIVGTEGENKPEDRIIFVRS